MYEKANFSERNLPDQSEEDFRCSRSVGTPVSEAVRGLCFHSHKIGKTESLYEGTE